MTSLRTPLSFVLKEHAREQIENLLKLFGEKMEENKNK